MISDHRLKLMEYECFVNPDSRPRLLHRFQSMYDDAKQLPQFDHELWGRGLFNHLRCGTTR